MKTVKHFASDYDCINLDSKKQQFIDADHKKIHANYKIRHPNFWSQTVKELFYDSYSDEILISQVFWILFVTVTIVLVLCFLCYLSVEKLRVMVEEARLMMRGSKRRVIIKL